MTASDHVLPINNVIHDIPGAARRTLQIVTRLLPSIVLLDDATGVSELWLAGRSGWVVLLLDGLLLLLVLLLLMLLRGEHVHARSGHEDGAEMAHVLGLAHHILRYAKYDAVAHHLRGRVLLSSVPLRCHHLL